MATQKTAIARAVDVVGGCTALAKKLEAQGYSGMDRRTVWAWVHRQHRAPARYFKGVCIATDMKVTVNALMDDHNEN